MIDYVFQLEKKQQKFEIILYDSRYSVNGKKCK